MVFFWDFMGERGFNMNAVGSEGAPPLVSRCLREATAYHGVVESVPPCGIPQTFAYTILVYIYIYFLIYFAQYIWYLSYHCYLTILIFLIESTVDTLMNGVS